MRPEICTIADKSPLGVEYILGILTAVAVIALWAAFGGWISKVLYMIRMSIKR